MSELGLIAVVIVTGIGLLGLFLVVTAFGANEPSIPQARIVDGRSSPIRPPSSRVRVSPGRLVVGVIVMMVAGSSLLFLFGSATTGDGLELRIR